MSCFGPNYVGKESIARRMEGLRLCACNTLPVFGGIFVILAEILDCCRRRKLSKVPCAESACLCFLAGRENHMSIFIGGIRAFPRNCQFGRFEFDRIICRSCGGRKRIVCKA